MAVLSTTASLLARLKSELRDDVPTSETSARLLDRLNEAHIEIVSGGGILNDTMRGAQSSSPFVFPWALSSDPIVFNTEVPVQNLTATVNKGSATVTLSDTHATSLAGWYIRIDREEEVYRILSHTDGTGTLTLDATFVGEDKAAVYCSIYKLDYTIGNNILLPTSGFVSAKERRDIPIIDIRQSHKHNVLQNSAEGFPSAAYVVKQDSVTKSLTVRFDRYAKEVERLEFNYVPVPADLDLVGSNPILPSHHNIMIVELAAYFEYDLRDYSDSKRWLDRATQRFASLKAEARQFTVSNDDDYGKVKAWSKMIPTLRGEIRGSRPKQRGTKGE